MGHMGKHEFHRHESTVTFFFFCRKIVFLVKGNVVWDITAINKAFYQVTYDDTGRSNEGRKRNPFLESVSVSM